MNDKNGERLEIVKQLTRMDTFSMALIISAALHTRAESEILKGVAKVLDDNIHKHMSEKGTPEYKQLDLF